MLPGMDGPSASKSPLELLGASGMTNSELRPGLRPVEIYTMQRMLKLLWFGDPAAGEVVVMMAGAMGGFSGPARAMYLELADRQVARDRGAIIVDYRKPATSTDHYSTSPRRRLVDACKAAAVHAGRALVRRRGWRSKPARCLRSLRSRRDPLDAERRLPGGQPVGDIPLLLLHGDRDEYHSDNSAMGG